MWVLHQFSKRGEGVPALKISIWNLLFSSGLEHRLLASLRKIHQSLDMFYVSASRVLLDISEVYYKSISIDLLVKISLLMICQSNLLNITPRWDTLNNKLILYVLIPKVNQNQKLWVITNTTARISIFFFILFGILNPSLAQGYKYDLHIEYLTTY